MVNQARLQLHGDARLPRVISDHSFWDGPTLWQLDQQEITGVVPAKTTMAMMVEAWAQAVAEADTTVGRRVHGGRHGQGRTAWTEPLETKVVGSTGLTTDGHYGPPELTRHATRCDCQAHRPTPSMR